MYVAWNKLKRLTVVLTYIHVETKDVWQFEKNYSAKVLENYFANTIAKYIEWIKKIAEHSLQGKNRLKDYVPFLNTGSTNGK